MNPWTELPQILIGELGRTTEMLNGGSNYEYPGQRWVPKLVFNKSSLIFLKCNYFRNLESQFRTLLI